MPAHRHVLVVDDNEPLLRVLKETLENNGFQVTAVMSGAAALNVLQTTPPDIIICDVMMPGMDGFQLQEQILGSANWCHIPFVFLTALASTDEVNYGRLRGCDEYVTKPFDPSELIAIVQGKLSLAQQRQHAVEQRNIEERRRIIQTLSHEFRTPLVAINTGSELLLEQYRALEDERIQHLLRSIHRGGQRLQRLVDDFMVLQQIHSGVAKLTHDRFVRRHKLSEIVESAISGFRESCEHQVDIHFEPEENVSDLYVEVHEIQVIDIVRRLLSNAQKFGGAQPIDVVVSCARNELGVGDSAELVSVAIRDRGPGLNADSISQLGVPFNQIDRSRLEQQGCGLGLTIASYLVQLNQGCLSFCLPEEGQGLKAELRFPRVNRQ